MGIFKEFGKRLSADVDEKKKEFGEAFNELIEDNLVLETNDLEEDSTDEEESVEPSPEPRPRSSKEDTTPVKGESIPTPAPALAPDFTLIEREPFRTVEMRYVSAEAINLAALIFCKNQGRPEAMAELKLRGLIETFGLDKTPETSDFEAKIKNLENRLTESEKDISDLEQEKLAREKQIERLTSQLEASQKEVESLKKKLATPTPTSAPTPALVSAPTPSPSRTLAPSPKPVAPTPKEVQQPAAPPQDGVAKDSRLPHPAVCYIDENGQIHDRETWKCHGKPDWDREIHWRLPDSLEFSDEEVPSEIAKRFRRGDAFDSRKDDDYANAAAAALRAMNGASAK